MPEFHISPVLIWFLVGIACYGIELALPGFILFFFGMGAWCTALALAVFDLSLAGQLVVFILASIVSLIALRSYLKNVFLGESKTQADSATLDPSPSIGTVIEDIVPPAEGKVKYAGSFWRASADEVIPAGTTVEIVDQQDLLIKVCSVQNGQSDQ